LISFKEEVALEGIITIKNLTCNHLICPLGVDTQTPVFNWNIEGALLISGYRLLVADSIEKLSRPNLWDSGNQPISNGPYIRYAGKPFCSRQQVFWKVGVTDGKQWWWSDATYFEMGLISDSDWKGRWIGQAFGAQNQEELNCIKLPVKTRPHTLEKNFASRKKLHVHGYIFAVWDISKYLLMVNEWAMMY